VDAGELAGADDHAAGGALDLLLESAALGPLRRLSPGVAGVRMVEHLARRPDAIATRAAELARELAKVAAGRSDVAPSPKDRRFSDPAWSGNPLLHRTLQGYLATATALQRLVDDAGLDWADHERVRFAVDNLVAALAPSNSPMLNPLAWKALIDTGGTSALTGLAHLVKDLSSRPRVPSMVENDAFEVGETLAVTPGQVVLRTSVCELIQYTPQTTQVRRTPLLIVPPMINKYYIIDLAPERSLVEYLLRQGQQVFVISWRNPDARHHDWGLDTYAAAVLDSMDAVEDITGSPSTHLLGLCSGGIMASMLAAHLAATGELHRVATFNLGVTVHAQARAGLTLSGDGRRDRAGGHRRLGRARLPRRRAARRGLRLAPAGRPDLGLQGQQLPAGQDAARFDVLSGTPTPPDASHPAPRVPRDGADERGSPTPAAPRCSARRSTCRRSTSTRTSSRGSPTTSAPGSRATRPPAARRQHLGSCCRPPVTSPRWSTRRPTRSRPTAPARATRPTPSSSCARPRPSRAPGGATTRPGWANAAVTPSAGRESTATRATSRWALPPAPTSRPMSRPNVVRTLTLNGFEIRVSVRRGGSGPGEDRRPPLLLCCGIGAGFEAFAPFVDSLDPRIEVIRFDVPGAGASPAGAWPIGFPGHAFLAARILTALGHRRADVLGLSWGGGLAQQLALQHPHRVRRLVLVSTGTGMMMWPGRPQVLGRMLTPRRFRDPEYAASLAGLLYGGSARTNPGQVRTVLGDSTRVGSWRGYRHQLMAGAVWTSLPSCLCCEYHADSERRRRPDHPGRQRPRDAPADPRVEAVGLRRRAPHAGD
jgi:pimeloyl-ACP methyl ester carboxylesterase